MIFDYKHLKNHPFSNCHVRLCDSRIDFISYNTRVISAYKVPESSNNYVLECTGTYSATTRRQISWFLREYFSDVSYYDMKNIVGTSVSYPAICTAKFVFS